jgi:hypothetical protein
MAHGRGVSKKSSDIDSGEAFFDNAVKVGGFALAVLGVILTVGLIILPSSTLGEKCLIILASVALSVVATAGLGAWRSRNRLTVTALSLGLSIAFLASLSIVAASQVKIETSGKSVPPASSVTSPSQVLTPTPSPSAPGTAQAEASTSGSPLYLASEVGDGNAWGGGAWLLGGTYYTQSLGDSDPCTADFPDGVTYQLPRTYSKFIATVGVADNADPGDHGKPLDFEVEANSKDDGLTSKLVTKSAKWHQPAKISISLPKNIASITLVINDGKECESSTGVWGNVMVTP